MKNFIKYFIVLFFAMPLTGILCSCSENDDTEEEFVDWQNTNESYFKTLYAQAQSKIASGDKSWKIIRCYTMPEDNAEYSYTMDIEDCIVAHVVSEGEGTTLPLYTDKARVHYRGRILPSASYSSGYVFDKSYSGTFDTATAIPADFSISGLVDGFATAVLNMHKGDSWEVYIPYQLGYGESGSTGIPAYSTLIFDITLVDFYHPDEEKPAYK